MHHGGNGFLIRMAVGERTIDVLSPQTCAECGSLVDPELGAGRPRMVRAAVVYPRVHPRAREGRRGFL